MIQLRGGWAKLVIIQLRGMNAAANPARCDRISRQGNIAAALEPAQAAFAAERP
jgi:hypothetical protein